MSHNGISVEFDRLVDSQSIKEFRLFPISHPQNGGETIEEALEEGDLVVGTAHGIVPSQVGNQVKGTEDEFYANLQRIKLELNFTKSDVGVVIPEYGGERWKAHTSSTHPFKVITQRMASELEPPDASLCTQAYCKFMEIVARYSELLAHSGGESRFRSLHLCEAPGAFILALKHCLDDETLAAWDWHMNSLNPFYEWADPKGMIGDDSLIFESVDRMVFGDDNSGNILHWDNAYISKLGSEKFQLVTADGSFDCSANPMEQESLVLPLISKEVQIALATLADGGHLLLKMYTFFEAGTVQLLAKLMANFHQIYCKKPASSKPGNSEVYLVCLDFFGPNDDPVKLDNSHRKAIEDCAKFFTNHQKVFIEFNLKSFNRISASDRAAMEIRKYSAVEQLAVDLLRRIRRKGIPPEERDLAPVTVEQSPWKTLWNLPIERLCQHIWEEEAQLPIELNHSLFSTDFLDLNAVVFGTFRTESSGPINFSEDPHITNSLFAHHSLLAAYSHKIRDICAFEPSTSTPPTTVQVHYSNGTVLTKRDTLSPAQWVELLIESHVDVDVVSLEFSKTTFVLSRFSASVLYILCLIFRNVIFSTTKIIFSKIKNDDAVLLLGFLEQFKLAIETNYPDRKLLQFIPLKCFANPDFYSPIVAFNDRQFTALTRF